MCSKPQCFCGEKWWQEGEINLWLQVVTLPPCATASSVMTHHTTKACMDQSPSKKMTGHLSAQVIWSEQTEEEETKRAGALFTPLCGPTHSLKVFNLFSTLWLVNHHIQFFVFSMFLCEKCGCDDFKWGEYYLNLWLSSFNLNHAPRGVLRTPRADPPLSMCRSFGVSVEDIISDCKDYYTKSAFHEILQNLFFCRLLAMSDILELHASSDDTEWKSQEKSTKGLCQLDTDSLFDLAVLHLERERQLGAARSDLAGMLRASVSLLKIREQMLSDSMLQEQRKKLLDLAETTVKENCQEIPPLSALIMSISTHKRVSANCQRIGRALTILLLHATPQAFESNTTLLSEKVNMSLYELLIREPTKYYFERNRA